VSIFHFVSTDDACVNTRARTRARDSFSIILSKKRKN